MFNKNRSNYYSPSSANPFNKKTSINLGQNYNNHDPKQPSIINPPVNKFVSPGYQQFYTPKSQFGYSNNGDTSSMMPPTNKFVKAPVSPAFATAFANERDFLNKNKKRQYSEISQADFRYDDATSKPYQNDQSPFSAARHQNLEDNSTIKPEQNTVVRNPTLSMMGLGGVNPGDILDDYRRAKNKNIQPLNLNTRSPFQTTNKKDRFYDAHDRDMGDDAQSDFEYKSAFDQDNEEQVKRTILQEIENNYKKHPDEIRKACQNVSIIIDQVAQEEANPANSDIANVNSKGQKYEYQPFQFLGSTIYRLPPSLLKEIHQSQQEHERHRVINYGLLSQVQLAYFIVNKRLYLWSYAQFQQADAMAMNAPQKMGASSSLFMQEFEQIVTHVAIANQLPQMKKKLESDEKLLIVATAIDIRVFILKKGERDLKVQLIETDLITPTEKTQITKIVQFNKNGRIFYGGSDGHVYELNVENNRMSLLNMFAIENKRLKKYDLMEESILLKLIPSFLKLSDKKNIIDIKIDEQRNVMYSLCLSQEQDTEGQAIIEVFDLGMDSFQFRKIVSLRQYEIVKEVHEFMNISSNMKGKNLFEITDQFQIIFISPIQYSESQRYNLLVITQNGLRIYISFETRIETDRHHHYDSSTEAIIQDRFTSKWRISDILNFPNDDAAYEMSKYQLQEGVFKVHTMNHYATHVPLELDSLFYNNFYSYLAYGISIDTEKGVQGRDQYANHDVEETPFIKMNFIKKNESALAHFKSLAHIMQSLGDHEMYQHPHQQTLMGVQKYNMYEEYSIMNIPMEDLIQTNRGRQQLSYFNRLHSSEQDSELNQSFQHQHLHGKEKILQVGSAPIAMSKEVQQMLGLKDQNSCQQTIKQGGCGSVLYQFSNLSEMEKQVYIPTQKLNILTDQRLIELIQLRPIDWLALILNSVTPQLGSSTATYYEKGVNPFQDLEDFIEQFSFKEVCGMCIQILAEPNNSYIFSKKINDLLIQTKKPSRQSQSQPRQNQPFYGGGGSSYQSQSPNFQRRNPRQQSVSTSYIQHQQQEYASKEFIFKTPSLQMRQLTFEVLKIYGEVYPRDIQQIASVSFDKQFCLPLSFDLVSYKHQALYLYLQRVLRPIWEQCLFVSPSRQDNMTYKLYPSFESFEAPKMKLQSLLDLISSHMVFFYYSESQSVNKQFAHQFKKKNQIASVALLSQISLISEVSNDVQDQIERQEKESLLSIKAFIQRCIDTIDLLEITQFEGDENSFIQLQKHLSFEQLKGLSELTFSAIVNGQCNILIRRLLDASVQLSQQQLHEQQKEGGLLSQKAQDLIKKRTARVRRLCNGLFSETENRVFIGETLLRAAVKESNIQRREELLRQALEQLTRDPSQIDLLSVVPLLVESGNYTTIVDLALRKVKSLKLSPQTQQINNEEESDQLYAIQDECYSIILSLFGALDSSISDVKEHSIINELISKRAKSKQNKVKSLNQMDQNQFQFENDIFFSLFLNKINEIPRMELKMALKNRISKRIEEYGDNILTTAIFDYSIKRSSTVIDLDNLPSISDERFRIMCQNILQNVEICRDEFENMVKMMIKRKELEYMGKLVLQVVEGDIKITQSRDGRGALNCQEKLSHIENAIQVCEQRYKEIQSQDLSMVIESLKPTFQALANQAKVLFYVKEKREAVDKLRAQKLEQLEKKKDKKQNHYNAEEEELYAIDQHLTELIQRENELHTEVIYGSRLTENYTYKIHVYSAYLNIIINYLASTNKEVDIDRYIDTLKEGARNLYEDTRHYYPDTWQTQLASTLQNLFIMGRLDYLKMILEEFSKQNERVYAKDQNLLEDVSKAHKGFKLLGTRYWLEEFCYECSQFKLRPSEIFSIFSYRSIDTTQAQNIGRPANKIKSLEQYFKTLILLKLWTKRNDNLFVQNTTIVKKQKPDISAEFTEQDEFYQDLKSSGKILWNQVINKDLDTYFRENNLMQERPIADLMKEVLEKVKKDVESMLNQHKVAVAYDRQQSQDSIRGNAARNQSSMFVGQQQMSQDGFNNMQFLNGFQSPQKKEPFFVENKIKSQSGFKSVSQIFKDREQERIYHISDLNVQIDMVDDEPEEEGITEYIKRQKQQQ